MAKLVNTGYLLDMRIVDERLTKLEKAYKEISNIMTNLSMDIKLIIKGVKENNVTNIQTQIKEVNENEKV